MHRNTHELITVDPLLNLRWLDITRERRDGVEADFHIVHELGEIDLVVPPGCRPRPQPSLRSSGPIQWNPGRARILQSAQRSVLQLPVARRPARRPDLQAGEPHLRIHFTFHLGETDRPATKIPIMTRFAATEFRAHQAIKPFISCSLFIVDLAGCSRVMARTSMPSTAAGIVEVTTLSPTSTPVLTSTVFFRCGEHLNGTDLEPVFIIDHVNLVGIAQCQARQYQC